MQNEFGKFLYNKRIKSSFSLKRLASLLGCTESYVCKMEKGIRFPSVTMLEKIKVVFDYDKDIHGLWRNNKHCYKSKYYIQGYSDAVNDIMCEIKKQQK